MELARKPYEIRKAAEECRERFLKDGLLNLQEITASTGLKILENSQVIEACPNSALKDEENACILYNGTTGFIIYDDRKSLDIIRFSIAHELGHYMLRHLEIFETFNRIIELLQDLYTSATEREADLFAEYLLGQGNPHTLQAVKEEEDV